MYYFFFFFLKELGPLPSYLLDIPSFLIPIFLIIPSLTSLETSKAAFASGQRRARTKGKRKWGRNRRGMRKVKGRGK